MKPQDELTERALIYAERYLAAQFLSLLWMAETPLDEADKAYLTQRVTATARDIFDIAARIDRFSVADCLRVESIGHPHAAYLNQALERLSAGRIAQ